MGIANDNISQTERLIGTVSNLIQSLIYALIFIYTFYRLKIFSINSNKLIAGKIMYILILFACGFRTTICISTIAASIQVLNQNQENKNYQTELQQEKQINCIFIAIGDLLDCVIIFCLVWQVVSVWYLGHIQIGNIIQQSKCPPLKKKYRILFFILILCQVLCIITTLILFIFTEIQENILLLIDIIVSLILITLVIFVFMFLLKKFSGSPYKNNHYLKIIGYSNKITIFLVICRCVQVFLRIYVIQERLENYECQFNQVFFDQKNFNNTEILIYRVFMGIAELVLFNFIPLLILLNISTVQLFTLDHAKEQLLNKQEQKESISKRSSFKDDLNQLKELSVEEEGDDLLLEINLDKLCIVNQNINLNKQKGLGLIQQVKIAKDSIQSYALRELEIQNLTNYILEEIQEDIKLQSKYQSKYIAKYRYIASHKNKIILISDFCDKGSLSDILKDQGIIRYSKIKNTSKKFSINSSDSVIEDQKYLNYDDKGKLIYNSKIQISLQIALIFEYLHHKLSPPISHGHLTSYNILFDKNMNIKLSDLGLIQLKKLMTHKNNYTNKSQYTAPEHLLEKGNIVLNATIYSDVYSFGMILYELFVEKEPFKDITLKEIKKIVSNENTRPKIPDDGKIGQEIVTLIRCCWQKDKDLRPNFITVVEILKNMVEQM